MAGAASVGIRMVRWSCSMVFTCIDPNVIDTHVPEIKLLTRIYIHLFMYHLCIIIYIYGYIYIYTYIMHIYLKYLCIYLSLSLLSVYI